MKEAIISYSSGSTNSSARLPWSMKLALKALDQLQYGRLKLTIRGGQTFIFSKGKEGPVAELFVRVPAMAKDVLLRGDIGFADAYMRGDCETPNLTALLQYFAHNFDKAGSLGRGNPVLNGIQKLIDSLTRSNTKSGSKRNILAHYDLGNDFYSQWLDPSMTYSAGIFAPGLSLEQAQEKKYANIAAALNASPDTHILEIGSGWGGFAEYAACNFGTRVTTVTISDAQHAYASKRIQDAGLSDKVDVQLRDYRDVEGQFDGMASIEMFEAVGEAFWPTYFSKVASVLKAGKRAALQVITIEDALFESYRNRVDFIQKYVFPGGMLPSVTALKSQVEKAGLRWESDFMFGKDYAETLRLWQNAFLQSWPEIEKFGFDTRFQRLWRYYLSYCEAGFQSGRTNVGHFVLQKP